MATPLRVLILEDNSADAELMLHALRRAGYDLTVDRVETEQDFRDRLQFAPEVILADFSMPELDARRAFDIMQECELDIPFIIVSGTIGDTKAAELMLAGAGDYLCKDNLARLPAAIERELREVENRRGRRRAEQSNRLLAAIVDSSDSAIISKTLDGVITSWNPAAERLYGWTATEAVGLHVSFIFPFDRQDELAQIVERLQQGEQVDASESVRLHRDGRRIHVLFNVSPIRDTAGKLIGVSRIARDITAQKAIEERLARDSMLLASVQDSTIVTDMKGNVTYWNEGATRLFGWTANEMLGRPLVERLPEDCRPAASVNGQGSPTAADWSGEWQDYRKDGSRVWIDARTSVIRNRDGQPVGIIGVSHDINDRKQAEEELQRSNKDLEQFAYVAAHDLQEPLRKVVAYSQLLSDTYKGRLDADADEFIGYCVDGATRMQALIRDLLAYSRVGQNGQNLAPTDCESVLTKALTALGESILESGAVVTHGAMPGLFGYEVQLVQLLQNLIGNAIKFRGPRPPLIHVSAEKTGTNWLFTVADNGIGVDPQFAECVFVIFQRLHSRTEFPGTGIGLAICKKIVERHGGRIWVESRPVEGSQFKFTIPTGARCPGGSIHG